MARKALSSTTIGSVTSTFSPAHDIVSLFGSGCPRALADKLAGLLFCRMWRKGLGGSCLEPPLISAAFPLEGGSSHRLQFNDSFGGREPLSVQELFKAGRLSTRLPRFSLCLENWVVFSAGRAATGNLQESSLGKGEGQAGGDLKLFL